MASGRLAKKLGLPLVDFNKFETPLDIAFDGADKVDRKLNLIKGLGGALVREKIADYRAETLVIMVGPDKMATWLSGIVPVEVIPMAEKAVKRDLMEKLGALKIETRMNGRRKFVSDNSNLILHVEFGPIKNPPVLEQRINEIAGVVDNGLFTKKKPVVIVGMTDGTARTIR